MYYRWRWIIKNERTSTSSGEQFLQSECLRNFSSYALRKRWIFSESFSESLRLLFFFPPSSFPSSSSKTKVFMKCLILLTNSAAKGCRKRKSWNRHRALLLRLLLIARRRMRRGKRKRRHDEWCYYSPPLLLLLFKRAKRTRTKVRLSSVVLLFSLSMKMEKRIHAWRKIQSLPRVCVYRHFLYLMNSLFKNELFFLRLLLLTFVFLFVERGCFVSNNNQ